MSQEDFLGRLVARLEDAGIPLAQTVSCFILRMSRTLAYDNGNPIVDTEPVLTEAIPLP